MPNTTSRRKVVTLRLFITVAPIQAEQCRVQFVALPQLLGGPPRRCAGVRDFPVVVQHVQRGDDEVTADPESAPVS
jgi:hypothetical protein